MNPLDEGHTATSAGEGTGQRAAGLWGTDDDGVVMPHESRRW